MMKIFNFQFSIFKFIIVSIISLALAIFIWNIQNRPTPDTPQSPTPESSLKIVSTNPSPLDGAIILPTQAIEITFNKPVVKSEFKHKFDPEVEGDVEVVGGINDSLGKTMKIVFKKPLGLGQGYTLFILSNTHTPENLQLDREYIYHFKAIQYKGV